MKNKEELIKKLLRAFEKECKELGVKYFIAVGCEIRIHAHPLYLATTIIEALKGVPPEEREITIRLMIEKLKEE